MNVEVEVTVTCRGCSKSDDADCMEHECKTCSRAYYEEHTALVASLQHCVKWIEALDVPTSRDLVTKSRLALDGAGYPLKPREAT